VSGRIDILYFLPITTRFFTGIRNYQLYPPGTCIIIKATIISVLYTSNPLQDWLMAVTCAWVILGIKIPLLVELTSNRAVVLAAETGYIIDTPCCARPYWPL